MKQSLNQKNLEESALSTEEELYSGKIFRLVRETLQFEQSPPHNWDVIHHRGAVALLPITEKGSLLLIQQWRRPIGEIIYEIPAGTLDEGEDPKECAQRELQEEIGMKAATLLPFGGIYSAPGFCTEYIHFFIAKKLSESSLPKDIHEAIDVVEMSLDEALSKIDSGEIDDAKTICAILRYMRDKHA